MSAARVLSGLAGVAVRRPRTVVALAVLLALGGGWLALGLTPTSATSTLVGKSNSTYRATQRFYRSFGSEAVVVTIHGPLTKWVFSSDLERELTMEGCISGNLPAAGIAHHGGVSGACGQLARTKPVKVVFGPGTFINESAAQIDDEFTAQQQAAQSRAANACSVVRSAALARHYNSTQAANFCNQARNLVLTQFAQQLVQAGVRYGLTALPQINDPDFVNQLIFDPIQKVGTPKERFAYLFPNADTAIITVRLKPSLSQAQQNHTIALIRRAVAMPDWRPAQGETYAVTGEPVIVSDLTKSITSSVELMLIAVLLVMAATLALVFSGRPRLLPLGVALLATALTFGALAISGAPLTMASIGVLPVLVGLAVDYSIQFQSRVQEAAEGGLDAPAATRHAARVGGPTLATAAAATAGGFLVLLLSPVPMVQGFGLLLVVGIVLSFLCAVTAGSAVMVLAGRRVATVPKVRPLRATRVVAPLRAAGASLASAGRGARELVMEGRAGRRVLDTALSQGINRPSRVLGVGLVLAALGWGLDTQTHVQTDITKLVPQNLASLRNLDALERDTGVGGEIDVMVNSQSLVRPQVVNWMSSYEATVLKRFGYSDASYKHGCGHATVCPAFSLPDLFAGTGGTPSAKLSSSTITGLLAAVPLYFSQGVITPDHHTATLAFGIRQMPLDRQDSVVQTMRSLLHPPPGVQANLVGLPVLAAQANAAVSAPWRRVLMLLAGLAAVALVLLVAFRGDRRRALVPLLPIALATGWSALILFAIRIPLNPMSVTMGALVIAISTEFSVLLSERYRQERIRGLGPRQALERTYRSTGAAVLASGTTAIAGFAVLVLSNISMLRGFGFATVIDLTVSLLGVLMALPATLLLAERGELRRLPAMWLSGALARVRIGGRTRHEAA